MLPRDVIEYTYIFNYAVLFSFTLAPLYPQTLKYIIHDKFNFYPLSISVNPRRKRSHFFICFFLKLQSRLSSFFLSRCFFVTLAVSFNPLIIFLFSLQYKCTVKGALSEPFLSRQCELFFFDSRLIPHP